MTPTAKYASPSECVLTRHPGTGEHDDEGGLAQADSVERGGHDRDEEEHRAEHQQRREAEIEAHARGQEADRDGAQPLREHAQDEHPPERRGMVAIRVQRAVQRAQGAFGPQARSDRHEPPQQRLQALREQRHRGQRRGGDHAEPERHGGPAPDARAAGERSRGRERAERREAHDAIHDHG